MSSEREPTFEQLLAWSMDAEPELLPFLPDLFADLEELGARAIEVLRILADHPLAANARVLELGCGKGAVALALAQQLDYRVDGVDGFQPFIDHARARAGALGLTDRCQFVQGDVLDAVVDGVGYDLVCMLALGNVLGRLDETVAAMRRCVNPGGLILIDDAYLKAGVKPDEDLINCYDHETTLSLLTAHGDEVLAELVVDGPESAANYQAMTAAIEARAKELIPRHPEVATLLAEFAERQRVEVDLLTGPVVGAVWLLRKAGNVIQPEG